MRKLFLIKLSLLALITASAQDPEYGYLAAEAEAEDGTLSGVVVGSSDPGYSGSGYVTGFDSDNDKVTVDMDVPETGFYRLVIDYNAPNGEKTQFLSVNAGPPSSLVFPATTAFARVDAGKYHLQKGQNSFSIIKSWGWSNIDKFSLYYAEANEYNISPAPVDSAANEETLALYDFLKLQFGKRIISGQTHNYYDEIVSLTGKSPMLRTGDFQVYTEGYPYLWKDGGHTFGKTDDGTVDELINWYNSTNGKGIVSFQWHWHSPAGGEAGTNTFYTDYTTFDITRAVTPGTPEYDDIIRDIDDISAELRKFQDAGIPVLWRPLHEAGGGWFWWGAGGAEACLELYDIMYDRMKNHHQLHNLIWVWSTPEEEWYPGNDKVDIIGYDSYPGDFNYGIQKTMFDALYRLTSGEKLIAMTENGPIPDPDACLEEDAPWLLFMAWSDLVNSQNSEQHIKDVYNNTNVLTLESDNAITGPEWRSSLYPEVWKPGYRDEYGRYLHDFSYAGYHKSEKKIPFITENIVDITLSPYNADNTGNDDVTGIIQQALDDVGASGGGVVYLPAGTYRVKPAASGDYALRIRYDSTILRGAGPGKTYIWNDETSMRQKDIIRVNGDWSGWFENYGTTTKVAKDVLLPTRIIPVESASGFKKGDKIMITNPATDAFITEHNMTGDWKQSAIKGVAFKRMIDSIDVQNNLLFIDAPTRYFLKTRDNAKVSHAGKHIRECGIEDLSIGNTENPKSGWDEESYSTSGTGAYDVHFSQAISMNYVEDSWIKNVNTYKPEVNTLDFHILSNCLILRSCRQVTVDSCFFQKPQYEGGGGNGYMYTLESNDCLIKNSRANHSRHNYDFKYPFSNGNVIHNCRGENSKYSSDFHMFLSMSNLFDVFTVNGDYLESMFRPWGGSWSIHGYSSTESVFYNTYGEAYHPNRDYIVESRQYKWGYIIGTSGPADRVKTEPVSGTSNGFSYDTSPEDMVEGVGMGQDLRPVSLYLDQFERRTKTYPGIGTFDVSIEVRDEISNETISDADVSIYNETLSTNSSGKAVFNNVLNSFYLSIDGGNFRDLTERQIVIYSDTSLVFYLERNNYDVSFRLYDEKDLEPFWGVNVRLGGSTKVTDNNGVVNFNVPEGEHEYSIDKLSYRRETGTLDVHSDTVMDFFLVRTHANIKFRLREGTTPVNDAIVKMKDDSLVSTSLGLAEFRQKPVGENYSYSITKENYHNRDGSLYLTTDTTINVEMLKKPSGINEIHPDDNFQFWPNPAEDVLFCRFKDYSKDIILKITDLKGKEIIVIENHGAHELIINTAKLDTGLYLLEYNSLKMNKSFLLLVR